MMNINKPKSFKQFFQLKEAASEGAGKDWKSTSARNLEHGFIPPPALRPVIRAFLNSGKISLMKNVGGKPITMPQMPLFLVGGPVRDFIAGKSIKDLDLATSATPEQVATILSAAGFKRTEEKTGQKGSDFKLPSNFENADGKTSNVEDLKDGEKHNMSWYIKGRDASKERKPFVIGAKVDGTEFDIATFRKDAHVTDGKASVEFSDSPVEDSARRDLTINAMYIELKSADSENKVVYDPTGHGLYHLQNGVVKTVGKADERFEEDPLRTLRMIRFNSKFGKGELDPDAEKAMGKFKNLSDRIPPDRIKGEFVKGLLDADVDLKKYIASYKKTGLITHVFPGIHVNNVADIPDKWSGKNDKILALAFLLHNNPIEKVEQALGGTRMLDGEDKQTGWENNERRAVSFLLKLKEFHPDKVAEYMRGKAGTGLTPQQIKSWVELMGSGKMPNHNHVKKFADYRSQVSWPDIEKTHGKCPDCAGNDPACKTCHGSGQLPASRRGEVVGRLEAEKFKQMK